MIDGGDVQMAEEEEKVIDTSTRPRQAASQNFAQQTSSYDFYEPIERAYEWNS